MSLDSLPTNPGERPSSSAHGGSPLLILISAPSGAGKTTVCQQLLLARPEMCRAITCTTRQPREGEQDGIDYYFLDPENFLKRVHAGNFLEHATVYGNSYGTLKAEVLGKLPSGFLQEFQVARVIDVAEAIRVERADCERGFESHRAEINAGRVLFLPTREMP